MLTADMETAAQTRTRLTRLSRPGALALIVATLAVATAARGADTLVLTGGKSYSGTFEGFRNGAFLFRPAQGDVVKVWSSYVQSMTLDHPTRATLSIQGRKSPEAATIKGFSQSRLIVSMDGREEAQPIAAVKEIQVALSLDRGTMAEPEVRTISTGDVVNVTNSIAIGTATILHFHLPSSIPSQRQGTYVAALGRDSHGKLAVVRVVVPDFDCPVARQYGLKSLPQFWFYSRSGQLVRKVTDRFSPVDIDAAVHEVMR